MQSIHGLATHSPESNKSSRWSLMELVQLANAKHPWLGYTQSWIQQKQPVEFDRFGTVANAKHPWLGYTQSWIQQKQPVEFDGFGTVLNQQKAMDLHIYMAWAILWSTESIKSSRWSLMDLVHMATCKAIHDWAILWSTESNKSSRWSLMDLVHMATCSIHWVVLWSTESNKFKQNQVVDFDGLGVVMVR